MAYNKLSNRSSGTAAIIAAESCRDSPQSRRVCTSNSSQCKKKKPRTSRKTQGRAKRGTSEVILNRFAQKANLSIKTFLHKLVVFLLSQKEISVSTESVYSLIRLLRYGVDRSRKHRTTFPFYPDIPYKSMVSILAGWQDMLTEGIGKQVYTVIFSNHLEPLTKIDLSTLSMIHLETLDGNTQSTADSVDLPVPLLGYRERQQNRCRGYYLQNFSDLIVGTLSQLYQCPQGREALWQLVSVSSSINVIPAEINRVVIENLVPPSHLDTFLNVAKIIQNSTFRIDPDAVFSEEVAKKIQESDWKLDNWIYFLVTLGQLNLKPELQYHPEVALQRTGRFHTRGGIMLLPQWLRHQIVKPVNSNNVLVELDLCSAQLILASIDWQVPELTNKLLELVDSGTSIWPKVGPKDLDKRIKKSIIYGFVFGADRDVLPGLASLEAHQSITRSMVDQVLDSGLLKPLVDAREALISSIAAEIQAGNYTEVNDVGLIFNAEQRLEQLRQESPHLRGDRLTRKLVSQLMAHRLQGKEQAIIHPLMIKIHEWYASQQIDGGLNCYSYDGLTYEVPPHLVEEFKELCREYLRSIAPQARLEYKVFGTSRKAN